MNNFLRRQQQIMFFALAGAVCAGIELLFFKMLSVALPKIFPSEVDFYGIHFPLSNILSTVLAIILNYFLSIWFVFEQGRHSKRREFTYFMVLSMLTTFLSLFFFQIFYQEVFKDNFNVGFFVFSPEIISKIAAIVVVSVFNFIIKKRLIFNG